MARTRWQRWKNWLEWRKMHSPVVFNEDTGEVSRLTSYAELPGGHWLMKRPLSLPESYKPLYVVARIAKIS